VKSCVVAALALACLLTAKPAWAQTTADAFVADVLAHNPSLRAASGRHAALRAEADAEGRWPDPRLEFMVDNVPKNEGALMPMTRLTASQMVMWPGKLSAMRQMADSRAEVGQTAVAVRRLDLALDARRALAMLAMNALRREINRTSAHLLDSMVKVTRSRYASGTGGHHDLARAEVERNALELERLTLEGERISAVAMLNGLRNQPPATAIADPEANPLPAKQVDREAVLAEALKNRPELQAMAAMTREMEQMTDLQRRERYPDFMTGIWWNQMFEGAATAGVMVGATVPIFSWHRASLRADAATLRAEAARADIEAMQAMIRAEVAQAATRLETAHRTQQFLRNVALRKVRETLDSALAGYATGSLDMTSLLEARRGLQVAELALAEAEVNRALAQAELDRVIGAPLPGGER
jgi:cobalt-zinc-cadmium efflux system outer membrane protein